MDFSKFQLPQWLMVGGGGVLLVAFLAYFTMGRKVKISAIVVSTLAGLGIGGGAGMFAYAHFGSKIYKVDRSATGPDEPQRGQNGPPGGGFPGGGRPGGGFPGGGFPGGDPGGRPGGGGNPGGRPGGGGGRFRPSSTRQLVSLVEKLDQLTGNKLKMELTPDQQSKIKEQVADLAKAEELSDEDAKSKLDALLAVLEDHKETLTSSGYRWPGERPNFGGGGPDEGNPFKGEEIGKKLQELQGRLAGSEKKPAPKPSSN